MTEDSQGKSGGGADAVDRLRDFLTSGMTMSHVYQPVMLRTILEGGGAASRRQIAAAFSAADLSQLEYYEQVVSRYPGPVLRRHGIVERDGRVYRLAGGLSHIDEWQRASLIAMCDQRVAEYVAKRQASIWAHRGDNREPLAGTIRWQVIRRAMGRCEACGISSEHRALEVDHIVPRSRGGSNDISNLQALCSTCNAQKSDRDATDFRAAKDAVDVHVPGCEACEAAKRADSSRNELAVVVPTTEGRLISPIRHGAGWLDLWQPEINAVRALELSVAGAWRGGGGMEARMLFARDPDPGHLALSFSTTPAGGLR